MDKKEKQSSSEIDDLIISGLDDETVIVTSTKDKTRQILDRALSQYSESSTVNQRQLNSQSLMKTVLTEDILSNLAWKPQEDIEKIKEINSYIDYYLNKDDIIGKTYEILESNTNTKYELTYPEIEGRNKKATLDRVKSVVENFNTSIDLRGLIVDVIPHTYSSGNRVLYLRKTNTGYIVDKYPLGVAQITSFKKDNEPLVMFSIPDLIGRLTGSFSMTIDSNSFVYKSIDEDIRNSFPKEVYAGYLRKDTYVRLDTNMTGVIRTNNRDKQYGLSPIFKALNPALKLEVQERSDSMDSKARGKKIIFQKISDKLLGENGDTDDLSHSIFSNQEFIKAWGNEIVLYTGAPWVDSVTYVEPKSQSDHFESLNYYRSKVLSALGISFLNGDNKTGVATTEISFNELMKTIDKISQQFEEVLHKWYKVVLKENGLPLDYAPKIKIIDAELLEMNLRMQLSDALFSKFGASFKTIYDMLGVDYQTEIERRKAENEVSIDEDVFYPRLTNFTLSSANQPEDYDKLDNKDVKKTNKTIKDKTNDVKTKEGNDV